MTETDLPTHHRLTEDSTLVTHPEYMPQLMGYHMSHQPGLRERNFRLVHVQPVEDVIVVAVAAGIDNCFA